MDSNCNMTFEGVEISSLDIRDGKVHAIGISAPVWFYFEYARLMMTRAAGCIPHPQRPLQRKIDTVLNKTAELVKDLKEHKQYCNELEQRKAERKEETRERQLDKKFEKMMGSGRLEKLMGKLGH